MTISVNFEQGNSVPRIVRITTTSTLTQVTAAGWYNNVPPNQLQPSDKVEIYYAAGTSAAANAFFDVTITAGVVTLGVAESNVTLPTIANHIATYTNTSGGLSEDPATAISGGNIQAGLSGTAGTVASFPGTASKGSFVFKAVANTGNTLTTLSNAAMGQASVISIPDPGAATANVLLDTGTAAAISVNNLKYGATPVAQVDPASCTITAAAGAANTATVTVQLKDGSGTNLTRSVAFRVYSSSAADGLTLQSAASTGYSVASGGLSLQNGAAVTTQISAMSSATGGCVLSLLDTGKQTSYLVLVLPSGNKISAQLSSGSYG